MSRPTGNVLALLEILQTGGVHTAPDLAERLGVDERTARRYIDHLIDLDIPVWSERGRYGGYRLAPGFRMPPLMLTDDEALAVMLGLVAGRRLGVLNAPSVSIEAAISKVRRVLPSSIARRVDALLSATDFTAQPIETKQAETDVLLTLAQAARDRKPVALDYTDRKGRRTSRTLHPHGIVSHSGRWYVIGDDPDIGESRTLRLDRVQSATMTEGSFDVPAGRRLSDELLATFAEAPYRHTVSVLVQASVSHIGSRIPPVLARLEQVGNAGDEAVVRVRMRVESLEWVPALLASLDRPFVIEEPDALRVAVRELSSRLGGYADAVDLD